MQDISIPSLQARIQFGGASRREDVLRKHRDAIRQAAVCREADSIALVGSVARGDDGDGSDYDFLVRFVEGASLFDLAGLQLDLEELLGRPCRRDFRRWPEGRASGHAQRRHHAVSRRDNDLIEDILDAAGKLAEIVAAGRKNLDVNWLVRSAAERQPEIIGEAAGKLEELRFLSMDEAAGEPRWL